MSCNVNLSTRLYGVYMSSPSVWTLSDELEFALFSDIISRNQRTVLNNIQDNTYNNITYNIDNSVTNSVRNTYNVEMNITYNAAGQIEPGDGDNTGNPPGHGGQNPGRGIGNNINTSV